MWTILFGIAALLGLLALCACWVAACWEQDDAFMTGAYAVVFLGATAYFASRAFW